MIFGKHINKYYLKYGWLMLLGILALVIVDYAQLTVPELYELLVNAINGKEEFNTEVLLDKICKPLLFVILVMVFGRFSWRICFFTCSRKMETSLRAEMFDHAKNLSQQYYSVNKVGNLMSLFTNDLGTVEECFGWGVMMLCDALFLGTFAVIKMVRMDGILTLFCLIPLTFLLLTSTFMGILEMKKWDARQAAFSSLSDFSQESFSGIAVIKAFVKELKEIHAFRKLNKKNEDANVAYTKVSMLFEVCVTLFVEAVICVILGYGGYLVYKGTLNVGQLFAFIGYFNAVIWPIMALSQLVDMRSRGKASLKRISELLDAKVDVCDRDDVSDAGTLSGDIEFKNLTFRYPGANYDALKNLSFRIRAGENVGIIGKTGAGKTTVVDLILRTYNVPDGTIFLDGKDVNSLSIESVRKNCAYVPQDNFLFSDTVARNIAFGVEKEDLDEIERVAMLASVADNIEEFQGKYQTVLGERGVTVSGGQKQRISIARALLKNSPILILDDSVSAVDTKTEKEILENLGKERKGKTTVLIAHRVSTIERMDKILFLEEGKAIAFGTHAELLESCPEYRKTVELQKLEEEKEENNNA